MENKIETHRHVLEDGTVIEHTHVEEYGSHHQHDGTAITDIRIRMSTRRQF